MDFSVIEQNWQYLLFGAFPDGPIEGAALTLIISLVAGAMSIVFGTLGGVALAMLRGFWMNLFAAVLGFFRAIPVIMLIFWTYFFLPCARNRNTGYRLSDLRSRLNHVGVFGPCG